MSENFSLEIISPDKTLFNSEIKQVVIPGYEGTMTILKDHISLITFLRPGFIEIQVEKLAKDNILKILEESKALLLNSKIKDKERYILSHKVDALQEIS